MVFLLGRVEDPVGGKPHKWIAEHQTWLQLAFEGANARLRQAADHRKLQHNRVLDAPFSERQPVLLCDVGSKGCDKIRDLWSSEPYVVLRVPSEGSAVYTIAPVSNQDTISQVHRLLVKPLFGGEPPNIITANKCRMSCF